MANEFGRNIKDTLLQITKAVPGTSASNTTDTIDLGSIVPSFAPENITVEISVPAMPLHVTAGNHLNITLWHGDTTSIAVPVAPVPTISVDEIGIVSTGSVGAAWRLKLPPGTKRYIGFRQTAGGTDDLSSYTITYSILT